MNLKSLLIFILRSDFRKITVCKVANRQELKNMLDKIFKIDWKKGIDENKPKLQQLSDRYIFTLCFYCAEINRKYRSQSFQEYYDFYKNQSILQPTIAEKEPYKSILKKIEDDTSKESKKKEDDEISNELQEKMALECSKYVNTHSDGKKRIHLTIIISVSILLTVLIAYLLKLPAKKQGYSSSYFILLAVYIISLFVSISYLFTISKKNKKTTALLINNISDLSCLNTLNEIYTEINKEYIPNTITEKLSLYTSQENNTTEDDYKTKPKGELVILFKKEYPKVMNSYPGFFYILQNCPYGSDKRILIDKNYKISKSTDRKMILCLITEIEQRSNNLHLIEALFEPNYSNLSDAMTQEHPKKKISDLMKFLDKEQKKLI